MVPDRLRRLGKMRSALVDELEDVLVPRRLGDGGAGEQHGGARNGEFPEGGERASGFAGPKAAQAAGAGKGRDEVPPSRLARLSRSPPATRGASGGASAKAPCPV